MGLSNAGKASEIKLPSNVVNSDYMVQVFRNLKKFFGISFKIAESEESDAESSDDDKEEEPKVGRYFVEFRPLLCV